MILQCCRVTGVLAVLVLVLGNCRSSSSANANNASGGQLEVEVERDGGVGESGGGDESGVRG